MFENKHLHIALVEPEIHWNTGNAGRTCLGLGATLHLVRPLGFDIDHRSVKRAGLDYWHRVDLEVWDDWATFEQALPGLGTPYFFSAEGPRRHFDGEYPDRVVLLFGKETAGFSQDIRDRYRDQTVAIPMAEGSLRSINLSTCVGIAGFEVVRQWSTRAG